MAILDYDILEFLERGRYLRLWSKEMDNLESEIIGEWFMISRRASSLYPDNSPLGSKLNEFPIITFHSNNTAALNNPHWKNERKLWRIDKDSNSQRIALIIYYDWERPCSASINTSSIWRSILFYNGGVLVTPDYILVKKSSEQKFEDFSSILGILTKFHIAGYWYIHRKREELLDKMGSKNKANTYMDAHQEELVWQLTPRFKTFKKRFWDIIDDIF